MGGRSDPRPRNCRSGGTAFLDMPLNSTPCCVTHQEFHRKRAALESSFIADFGIWEGLVPGFVREMAGMAARGVVGFKAFMCDSGLPKFPRANDATLYDGLIEAARLWTACRSACRERGTDAHFFEVHQGTER